MPATRKYELDMCNGPIFSKLVSYSVPLMLTGMLQLLYNAVNIVVVGRFVGSQALAAVGSTSSLINLIITLFIGLSVGTSLVMAKYYGAQQLKDANDTVHTSIALSAAGGVVLAAVGILLARPLLALMDTPQDVLDMAAQYMRIYFICMPASMIFNFGSALLRAVGDTRRPLYYLSLSGLVNIGLNLLFVRVYRMSIAGVALATVLAQHLSMTLILICLVRSEGCVQLNWRKIRFDKGKMIEIARIGLPAGVQGIVFSLSNVLIQSSLNSFGSTVMAGNTAAANIEGFTYIAMNAFYQAMLSFTGQNMGAKKFNRIGRILGLSLLCVSVIGIVLGLVSCIFAGRLLGIYAPGNDAVIAVGITRLWYICAPYFLCGVMEVLAGSIRGMGYSVLPMLASILGVCGIRITWIYTAFALHRTLETLYLSYPVSWTLTALVHLLCFVFIWRRLSKGAAQEEALVCRN
ncbi:MAG: MATE family efflux transporter [Eubacteriales bacterium]|nr:MATE family efflux transporter [Eubacteriales bacterium]